MTVGSGVGPEEVGPEFGTTVAIRLIGLEEGEAGGLFAVAVAVVIMTIIIFVCRLLFIGDIFPPRIDGVLIDHATTIVKQYSIELEYNRSYNVMVESTINNNVYLNRSLIFNAELANFTDFTDFTDGSICFRTYHAPIYFSNLNYTGIPITTPPTVYLTSIPSLVLNYSIIVDSNAVRLFFIQRNIWNCFVIFCNLCVWWCLFSSFVTLYPQVAFDSTVCGNFI